MNNRKKAELRRLIVGLEEVYEGELKAAKKHERAGETSYAKHAAWCAEGIHEAIMLIQNKFPADAIALLKTIASSMPTDVLLPHDRLPMSSLATVSAICETGGCNHPEHM